MGIHTYMIIGLVLWACTGFVGGYIQGRDTVKRFHKLNKMGYIVLFFLLAGGGLVMIYKFYIELTV